MIDTQHETLVLLADLLKDIPGRPHISTGIRWTRGLKDGRRLAAVKIGGRLYSSREAFQRFSKSVGTEATTLPVELPKRQRERLALIDRQLDQEGL